MRKEARRQLAGIAILAMGAALLGGVGSAQEIKYVGDGAVQNSRGGWDLPKQGSCPADLTAKTRPECVARRFDAKDSAACTALGAAGRYSWSTGVCTDLVNTTKAACEKVVDRYWNANGSCAIVMADDDRNAITCGKHGGTWVTPGTCTAAWVMPSRSDPAYGPGGLLVNDSTSGAAGTGDQCLRCHNTVTQYNSPRVRDTEDILYMGHKNMARPVDQKTFQPWGGPPFSCTGHPSYTNEEDCIHGGGTWDPTIYPSDDGGNVFKWTTNQITVGANTYDLKWIYGDWLGPLPRAIYTGSTLNNMSYSCGRCHNTGWTSDAGTTPKSTKHPESDFPGITWTGTGTTGQVKLGGGVAGDANIMSSWDQWGITCSRCHYSAVDASSSAPNIKAPAGMSTHHNTLTGADATSGYCTDSRWSSAPTGSTLEALCTSNGGKFLTACSVNPTPGVCTVAANTQAKCSAVTGATWVPAAGWCSNAFYKSATSCTANGYTWTDGWCKTADAEAACTGGTGDGAKTWRLNGSLASCLVAGASWTYSSCSVEGYCDKGTCSKAGYTNAVECAAAGATWTAINSKTACDAAGGKFAYATDVIGCEDAGGRWNGNRTNRGQIITSLCMECHRQETSGLPNTKGTCSNAALLTQGACVAGGATWTETGNGLPLTVGPYHSTVAYPSHPHGNQFLNSPHAKFVGKWGEVATGKYSTTGPPTYLSTWMTMGEAGFTGNGCTGCHEVHTSTVAGERPFRAECTECHGAKNLDRMQHPAGPGTPLEKKATEPMESCVSCHMPGGQHVFRINTNKSYSTFPMPQAMAANTAANTAPDGNFTDAVWVDLDAACGQCHGGGASNVKTSGTIAAASASLTVASATGLAVGEKILIAGAGAFSKQGVWSDFPTYIKAIAGNVITLAGNATHGVTNAAVTQNAATASYMTKATLEVLAKGIHNDIPLAKFTAKAGANDLTAVVDASASRCTGTLANCDAFDWNWGDNSEHGSGVTATHTYFGPGSFNITLTVKEKKSGVGTATQSFAAKLPAGAPTVVGSCAPNYPARSVACTVTVPAAGYQTVSLNFGDYTLPNPADTVTNPAAGPLAFTHVYQYPGNYSIVAKVVDKAGLSAQAVIGTMAKGSFNNPTISGKVLGPKGQPVGSAKVSVWDGSTLVMTTTSAADGSYSTGELKPGTYTIKVSKWGQAFAKTYGPFTIGPDLKGLENQNLVAGQ